MLKGFGEPKKYEVFLKSFLTKDIVTVAL